MSLINVTNLTFAYEGRDEPLNFIDVISHMQIEKLLIEHESTILFVEHDSAFCENVVTKIIKL